MKYEIKKRTIGPNNHLGISQQRFESVRDAHQTALELLATEEKFNILRTNYAEYEQVLLSVSLRRMLFLSFEWSTSINELHEINRALVNLLSTCRLYLDQIPHNLNKLFKGDPKPTTDFKKQSSDEYDNHLGYRVMEALRNYSQHRALPLHKLETITGPALGLVKHSTRVSVDVARLAEDKDVKQKIIDELKAQGDYIDVKPLVREYLECFMRLHKTVRELVRDKVENCQTVIHESLEEYRATFNEEPRVLGAFAIDDAGKTSEEIPIFNEPMKRLEFLVKKNHLILNLMSHFVTSAVEP